MIYSLLVCGGAVSIRSELMCVGNFQELSAETSDGPLIGFFLFRGLAAVPNRASTSLTRIRSVYSNIHCLSITKSFCICSFKNQSSEFHEIIILFEFSQTLSALTFCYNLSRGGAVILLF